MILPIYSSNEHKRPDMQNGNMGLRFARFFDEYKANWSVADNAKTAFINKFSKPCGDVALLEQACQKQFALTQNLGGESKVYTLDWHMITGMGISHPVENGFLWHYTLGVPYISGSQVKGLLRAALENYMPEETEKEKTLKANTLTAWFGSANKDDKDTQAGQLICFDAIPVTQPKLTVDIMTPHMKDWYANGGNFSKIIKQEEKDDTLPADWHDPVVIPFLAVKEAKFLFSIALRGQTKNNRKKIELGTVFNCLNTALDVMGMGAKTQTGYGYMSLDEQQTQKLEDSIETAQQKKANEKANKKAKAEAIANASELEKKLIEQIDAEGWRMQQDASKHSFTKSLSTWLDKLEANPTEQGCVNLIIDIAQLHYSKQMKKPEKAKPNQKKWIARLMALKQK